MIVNRGSDYFTDWTMSDLRTGLVFYGRDLSADFLPFCGWDDILQTCFGQTGDVFNFLVDRTMTCWTRQL